MSKLEIILTCTLALSAVFNVGVFVYARSVVARLLQVSEELGDLQQMINSFARHTKSVYELESFYGDPTLQHLLHHAISLNEQLETFEYIYTLTEEEIPPEYREEEDTELDAEDNEEAS